MANKNTLKKRAQKKRRKERGYPLINPSQATGIQNDKFFCGPCNGVAGKECDWCYGKGYYPASRFGW